MNYFDMLADSVEFIEEHLDQALTLDDLARRYHLSRFHYLRIFQAVTLRSPGDYIDERRVVAAARRLRLGNLKIVDIAFDLGFHSHEAFTRRFRQFMGVTPLEYRRGGCSAALPEKIQVVRRSFKNLNRAIVADFSVEDLPEQPLGGVENRFDPDSRADLERIHGLVEDFVARYLAEQPNPRLFCVTRSEYSQNNTVRYFSGLDLRGAPLPPGLKEWALPAGRYAVFRYRGEMMDIHQTVFLDICRAIIEAGLTLDKSGIDLFEAYDQDYREQGFRVFVPIRA